MLDGLGALRQRVAQLGQLGVDGHELVGLGVAFGVGDGPHDAVVVAHHGDRPAVDRCVALDLEDDVVAPVVLQRRLQLHERAGHGERVERRDLVPAQVEALVGLGERETRPDDRRGQHGADDDRRAEHQPQPVRRRRRVVGLVGHAGSRRAVEALADDDEGERAGEDPGALGQRQPPLVDGEQQAQRQRQDRADRRQAGAARVAGDLAADRGGEPGDGEGQGPELFGDVGGRGARQQVGPAVDQPPGERRVGGRGRDAADGDAAEQHEGDRRQRHALAEQQPAPVGEQHDGRRTEHADRRGGDEAPSRQRAAERDRGDHRHRRHDRDGDRDSRPAHDTLAHAARGSDRGRRRRRPWHRAARQGAGRRPATPGPARRASSGGPRWPCAGSARSGRCR